MNAEVAKYLETVPENQQVAIKMLRNCILENLQSGFEEALSYGSIGYVIPHIIHPAGYHCNPKLPVPFLNLAAKKNHISLHNLAIYGSSTLADWFELEYSRVTSTKLDMGKGCIRFKNFGEIPFDLIGALVAKTSVSDLLAMFQKMQKK